MELSLPEIYRTAGLAGLVMRGGKQELSFGCIKFETSNRHTRYQVDG